MQESTSTLPHVMLPINTYPQPSVLSQKALPPQEIIERASKSFIRLIAAKEIPDHDSKAEPQQTTRNHTTNKRKNRYLHTGSGS